MHFTRKTKQGKGRPFSDHHAFGAVYTRVTIVSPKSKISTFLIFFPFYMSTGFQNVQIINARSSKCLLIFENLHFFKSSRHKEKWGNFLLLENLVTFVYTYSMAECRCIFCKRTVFVYLFVFEEGYHAVSIQYRRGYDANTQRGVGR